MLFALILHVAEEEVSHGSSRLRRRVAFEQVVRHLFSRSLVIPFRSAVAFLSASPFPCRPTWLFQLALPGESPPDRTRTPAPRHAARARAQVSR